MRERSNPEVYLKRIKYFLKLFGNPEKEFKIIHVGGTSGKGSTVAMIHSILDEAGKKVGSFYSPHPTTSIERIKVGKKYISSYEFIQLVNKIKPYLEKCYLNSPYGLPSYFETFLVLALLYFQQKKCEYVILEVGCGGRYDATNVVEKPKISIITNINFDHTNILGRTLKKIAYEKAGIIKKNRVLLTAETRPQILKIFKKICQRKSSKFIKIEKEELPFKLSLLGDHQLINASLSKKATQILQIPTEFIKIGLKKAFIPCRIEIMQKRPLVLLDGAHNPSKIKALVDTLSKFIYDKLWLIIGINKNKDIRSILKLIVPKADELFLTHHLEHRSCANLKFLFEKTKEIKKNLKPKIFIDPKEALKEALRKAKAKDLILITGSFYLVGDLRKYWVLEEEILKKRKS